GSNMNHTLIPLPEPQRLRAVRQALRHHAIHTHASPNALHRAFCAAQHAFALGRSGATAYHAGTRLLHPHHLQQRHP
ncbi:hypothetical protein LOD44_12025, partial [Xylella fastidiosa subsp. multiplex]